VHRHRDDLWPGAGKTVAPILTFRARWPRRTGCAGDAACVVGRTSRAAFTASTAIATRTAVTALAARNLCVHQSGEERLFGRCDDRDLSAASAGPS